MQILVDPISLTMMLIVTGIGGLIILYSLGYMAGEDEERRYFAYMSLFVFSMLLLVMGGNLLLLLAGWGLVGLASYLLIGYYHDRPEAIAAAKKAFIMNAIGDAAMALGFFLLIAQDRLARLLHGVRRGLERPARYSHTANLVALGLLGGAVAKSAQLPLQTWLPDAMEGPTPGLCPHPRGDDGHRRRLPDRPCEPDLRGRARRAASRRHPRRPDPAAGGPDRARAVRHQARDRILDDVADRLHVPRGRGRRVRLRDVPPAHARILQGAALPRRRRRHPPPFGRAGHAQDGWPAPVHAADLAHVPDRNARADGDTAAVRASGRRTRSSPRRSRRAARSDGSSTSPA